MFDHEFEGPLFKRLPSNDTGAAPGHQAGFLVPKDLDKFFPSLPDGTTELPAPSVPIRAILVVVNRAIATVETVYQHQTWGGTRTPERRVTANLGPLRDRARAGDLLLIERSLEDEFLYRFTLLPQGTPEFAAADALTGGKRWGVLSGAPEPISKQAVDAAERELLQEQLGPFQPFDENAATQSVRRIARSRAFRRLVIGAYKHRCTFCGGGLVTATGLSEIEAAHIIGRGALGSDDVRNGVALCRAHHWAFDRGLVAVDKEMKIVIKPEILALPPNAILAPLQGARIIQPVDAISSPHPDAFAWHRRHVYEGYPPA